MLKKSVLLVVFASLGVMVLSAFSQPQDEKGKKGPPAKEKKGPPGGDKKGPPPGWEPGKIIPPHILHELKLSPEQQDELHQLEKEVRGRILKMLTPEQKDRLREMKPKGPPEGFKDKGPKDKGPKDKGPKGKPKDDDEQCQETAMRSGQAERNLVLVSFSPLLARREQV